MVKAGQRPGRQHLEQQQLPIISFDEVVQLHYCRSPAAEPEDANLDTTSTTKLEDQGMSVGLATKVRFSSDF